VVEWVVDLVSVKMVGRAVNFDFELGFEVID